MVIAVVAAGAFAAATGMSGFQACEVPKLEFWYIAVFSVSSAQWCWEHLRRVRGRGHDVHSILRRSCEGSLTVLRVCPAKARVLARCGVLRIGFHSIVSLNPYRVVGFCFAGLGLESWLKLGPKSRIEGSTALTQ